MEECSGLAGGSGYPITVADKKGGGFEAYKLSTTTNLVG